MSLFSGVFVAKKKKKYSRSSHSRFFVASGTSSASSGVVESGVIGNGPNRVSQEPIEHEHESDDASNLEHDEGLLPAGAVDAS